MKTEDTEDRRVCPSCGNEFSGAVDFCPLCMLRKALAGETESDETSAAEGAVSISEQMTRRFEHYELMTDEARKPVELGRGAMGVTYKALDVDLRCPVTLKVIGKKNMSVMKRRNFDSCAKHAPRLASDTRMLPQSSIWGGALRVTSTRWSL
jgi:rubredoxin